MSENRRQHHPNEHHDMSSPDRYAVIGNPISQSKSPLIHMAFAQETGQDLVYTAIEGPLGRFAETVDAFRAEGGRGLNVTLPFKLDACAYATDLSDDARAAGAANALKFEGSRAWAQNFDGVGLVRDITHNLGHALRAKRVLLLGAGGASRGAILPILNQAPACLFVANRTAAKASELVRSFHASGAPATLQGGGLDELGHDAFDVIINATSASLSAETPALPVSAFVADGLAYDMVYGKGLTPFLKLARQAGVRHLADGAGMLVEQAAEAFAWWRGVRPETRAMIERISSPLV
ncbi:MAG: shikimate 5-dehydrogenase [Pseudomonadota bacterium]|jgi:shikimate dehydrogenase